MQGGIVRLAGVPDRPETWAHAADREEPELEALSGGELEAIDAVGR